MLINFQCMLVLIINVNFVKNLIIFHIWRYFNKKILYLNCLVTILWITEQHMPILKPKIFALGFREPKIYII